MLNAGRDIVTFNAFELVDTPSIVVVFITKIADAGGLSQRLNEVGREEQMGISEQFTLVAVAVADEAYFDEIWARRNLRCRKRSHQTSHPIMMRLRWPEEFPSYQLAAANAPEAPFGTPVCPP